MVVLLDLVGGWQSTYWEWWRDIIISQDVFVYSILDKNLEGVLYIFRFNTLRDYKNRKIMQYHLQW